MDEYDMWRVIGNSYKPIDKADKSWKGEWGKCPECGEKPRVWIFDNGCSAKCLCDRKYEPERVFVESIVSAYKRDAGANYDRDNLRKEWNAMVMTGDVSAPLPEGQW